MQNMRALKYKYRNLIIKGKQSFQTFTNFLQVDKNGDMKVISIDTHSVGKNISTKAVGSNHRTDLTLAYKYPERELSCC